MTQLEQAARLALENLQELLQSLEIDDTNAIVNFFSDKTKDELRKAESNITAMRDALSQHDSAPSREQLAAAVRKMHAAKGRYHSQIATCDLFDLLGLPCVRPGQDAPPQEEQEPFGYFRAEPFGWIDCAPTDEGARPLYERPQAVGRIPLTEEHIDAIRAIERAHEIKGPTK